ncbi:uncharacterized protein LOC127784206 [Oryza glaberrima]|uniref:uncharacterized protein LOC127784206 n=1 Tax=Oryza glaberrima TaxID=4538 RepID=UPI00224C3A1E|nr:uncharacterized protein LOC127784206 [Oryza glaberrima]
MRRAAAAREVGVDVEGGEEDDDSHGEEHGDSGGEGAEMAGLSNAPTPPLNRRPVDNGGRRERRQRRTVAHGRGAAAAQDAGQRVGDDELLRVGRGCCGSPKNATAAPSPPSQPSWGRKQRERWRGRGRGRRRRCAHTTAQRRSTPREAAACGERRTNFICIWNSGLFCVALVAALTCSLGEGVSMEGAKHAPEIANTNRRAPRDINNIIAIGAPHQHMAMSKRGLLDKPAAVDPNKSQAGHRPMTRKFTATLANQPSSAPWQLLMRAILKLLLY